MASLDHPNIVRYLGAQQLRGGWELAIFQEWVAGGSLSSVLAQFGGHFEEPLIRRYLCHLLAGLAYLHGEGVVHRDIKGENVRRCVCVFPTASFDGWISVDLLPCQTSTPL